MFSGKELAMELLIITSAVLSIFLSALLPLSTASLQIDHLQPWLQPQVNEQQVSFPTLPRKLKLTEQFQEYEGRDFTSCKKLKEKVPVSGKQEQEKQSMVVGRKGIKEEWEETGDDPSQYFTMDYSRVRRGRPIHNKHLKVGP